MAIHTHSSPGSDETTTPITTDRRRGGESDPPSAGRDRYRNRRPNAADLQVKTGASIKECWPKARLGLGESFMEGWWDCEDLVELIARIASGDLEKKLKNVGQADVGGSQGPHLQSSIARPFPDGRSGSL